MEVKKSGVAMAASEKAVLDRISQLSGIRSFFLIGQAIREWAQVHGYQHVLMEVDNMRGGSDATSM